MDFRELLRQHPFLRILFPLLIGILLTKSIELSIDLIQLLLVINCIPILLFVSVPILRKARLLKIVFGIFLFLLFVNLGIFRVQIVQTNMQLINACDSCAYKVQLVDNPIEKSNTYSCAVKVCESITQNQIGFESAKAMLYFQKDSIVSQLKTGDFILISSVLNRVKNAGNPYEFDYAGYLKTRHILYSSYVRKSEWIKLKDEDRFNIRAMAWKWRDKLLHIYQENGIKNESFDILAALTLGYKSSLDPEIKRAWADAGAMHVLAVSGLHVGIIYLVMSYLLGFLQRVRFGLWIRCVALLFTLWSYALITGLSPSVMRAACMFSFIIIGEAMRRKGGIFNSLAASAFFLLLYDPYLLFGVGFQFSYLAVAGIVFFQPKFDSLVYVSNPILRKFWQLTTVALAAQIATFPLAIYYFNQFPTYFLLSGYVVILVAGILIYLSALLLILSSFDWIANALGWILQKTVELLNHIIVWIHELPGAVIRQCNFTTYEVILLYLILFALIFVLVLKRKYAVYTLLILLIAIKIPTLAQVFHHPKNEIVVFNVANNSLVSFKSGERVCYLLDKSLPESKFELLTKSYNLKKEIQFIQKDTIQDIDFRIINNTSILIIEKKLTEIDSLFHKLKPDIIVLRKSALKMKEKLTKHSLNSLIVIDGSVYRNDLQRLRETSELDSTKFFITRETGAFIFDLSSQN